LRIEFVGSIEPPFWSQLLLQLVSESRLRV